MNIKFIPALILLVLGARPTFGADQAFLTKLNAELELAMPSDAASTALRERFIEWARARQDASPIIADASLWSRASERIMIAQVEKRADQLVGALAYGQTVREANVSPAEQTRWAARALLAYTDFYADLSQFKGNPKRQLFRGLKEYGIMSLLPGLMFTLGYPVVAKDLGWLPTSELREAALDFGLEVGSGIAAASVAFVVFVVPRIPALRASILNDEWRRQYDRVLTRAEQAFWVRVRTGMQKNADLVKMLPADDKAPLAPMVLSRLIFLGEGVSAACGALLAGDVDRPESR